MLADVRRESCKRVTTADRRGAPNGFLVELYKSDRKTRAYLTAAYPGAFKGYHLHTVRASHYVCLKGKMKITIVEGSAKVEHVLEGARPERLMIPPNLWIGLENVGTDEAWLVNLPEPPYDPDFSGEQKEKSPAEISAQLAA